MTGLQETTRNSGRFGRQGPAVASEASKPEVPVISRKPEGKQTNALD